MATLAAGPFQAAAGGTGNSAVSAPGLVSNGTVYIIVATDFTNEVPYTVSCTHTTGGAAGPVCNPVGGQILTSWGGTNMWIQMFQCDIVSADDYTFTTVGASTDSQIAVMQTNEKLVFDNTAQVVDAAYGGSPTNPQVALTTGAAHAFVLAMGLGPGDPMAAGVGLTFVQFNINQIFFGAGSEYCLDAGSAGSKTIDFNVQGATPPYKMAILANSWIPSQASPPPLMGQAWL